MTEIKIIIGKDGKVNLDVAGVKGSACKELTKSIEKALGKTTTTQKKSEYFQQGQSISRTQNLGN
jgi:hypothetical protein